jgi:ferrous iron transport protein A
MVPLGLLSDGECGEIVAFRGRDIPADACGGRAEDMGLRVGKRVEMLANGGGPVLVKVDESRIAVARGVAMRIVVRRS